MKLNNGEILRASQSLGEIRKLKLPVKISSDLVSMAIKLDEPIKAYDEVRKGLVETYQIYSEKDGEQDLIKTRGKPEDLQKFMEEINELLGLETEVVIQKVKLPEKIAGTCDKCSHNMDVPLLIEGEILLPLQKLVEVG